MILMRLLNETSEALGGSCSNPARTRKSWIIPGMGASFTKLNSGDISKKSPEKLVQLRQSLDNVISVLPFKSSLLNLNE
ncbi:hypothetical protein Vadar_004543 [Vaccinium darrowii]|uniref:Uncharacterized protein n=1 Tax=Vaccinium darrowii TaxID=229202 RepID=A0ACB7YTB0_9ERIC|nr:hypothetical protein Vadar_004543 [Vaccinium darrowii]